MNNLLSFNKKKIALCVGVAGLLVLLWWVFSQTFLFITFKQSPSESYSLKIIDQENGEVVAEEEATTDSYKKRIPRGTYEVWVNYQNKTHTALVSTSYLFQSTPVEISFAPQSQQVFTGNGARSCINALGSTLVSWRCNTSINNALVHEPATVSTPTYTRALQGFDSMVIEGMLVLHGERYAFMKIESHDGGGFIHGLYPFDRNNNVDVSRGKILNGITSGSVHNIQAHGAGFIVYSQEDVVAHYFSSVNDTTPEDRKIPKPQASQDLQLVKARFSETHTSALYASTSLATFRNNDELDSPLLSLHEEELSTGGFSGGDVRFITQEGASTHEYTFNYDVVDVVLCGENKICSLANGSLSVAKAENGEFNHLYALHGVQKLMPVGKQLFLLRDDGVVVFDVEEREGDYSFINSGTSLCGATSLQNGKYGVCMQDTQNSNSVLVINSGATTDIPISQKVSQLSDLEAVRAVSVQGNFIYVSPNVGEKQYNQQKGMYEYSPARVESTSNAIRQRVQELGLESDGYTVINPLR